MQKTPSKPRFWISKRARTFSVVEVPTTRLQDFARGLKCSIVSAPAPLTILSLGHVLQISHLSTKKEVQKPYGFWRAFGYFSRVGKVPRRRQDKPIQLPFPPKKQSRTSHALLCSSHASSQNIEPQHHDAEDNQHNPRRAVERLRRGLIREHRRDPRPEEREHHAQRQHRPVRRAADGEV